MLDAQTGAEVEGNNVEGVLAFKRAWPSIARTVYGDHKRYLDVYLNPYKVRRLIRFDSVRFALPCISPLVKLSPRFWEVLRVSVG